MGDGENSEHPWQSKAEIAAAEPLVFAGEKLPEDRERALGGWEQAVDQGPARPRGASTERPRRLVSSTIPGSERYAEAKQLVEDHLEEIADPWHRRSPE